MDLQGELLRGYDYDDCPDFAGWVEIEREHLLGVWREALETEAGRLEEEGELRKALALALRLSEADPFSEEHLRRLMRLHYLRGDRGALTIKAGSSLMGSLGWTLYPRPKLWCG